MGVCGASEHAFLTCEKHLLRFYVPISTAGDSGEFGLLLLFFSGLFIFYVYECFARMYVCVPHDHSVPSEVRRQHEILWN